MKDYIKISNEKAYHLLNSGALILVSTRDSDSHHNIAPIAWHCPVDYDRTTKLLFVCDKEHKTFSNIEETREFIISLPHISQVDLVKKLGSVSGKELNKFTKFSVQSMEGEKIKCLMPVNCIGHIECKVYKIISEGEIALIFGEVVNVIVDRAAYENRLLSETTPGKTIHHLGGKTFISPHDFVVK